MPLDELLAAYPPRIRRAFLDAIRDIQSQVVLKDIAEALGRGDIQRAIDVINLDRAAFLRFEQELEAAFADGGVGQIEELGRIRDPEGNRVQIRFGVRNLPAERIIRDYSAQRVVGILDDQRDALRLTMEAGLSRGDNPTRTALDVAGRVNRRTGRREGGILGLTAKQVEYVESARSELTSADPATLRRYLGRDLRDKRFDSVVRRAIKDGKPLPQDTVTRIVGRYNDRMLKFRADTIARTETLSALNMGRHQAVEQVIATGKVRRQDVRLVWDAAKDRRTRDTHWDLDGQSVAYGEAFHTIRGNTIRFPGDPRAPAEETINCRCKLVPRIDFLANALPSGRRSQ